MELEIKRFEDADEVRSFDKGTVEVVRIGGMTIGRAKYAPDWKWSEHVGAITGTASYEVEHLGLVVSGRAACSMSDGRELDWALVVFLIGFGFLGLLSIGLPFLLLGITLAILARRRHETGVIAAGVAAIVGFTLGYILVVPLNCTMTESSLHPGAHTVCSNILGINYSGAGIYNPSVLPPVIAGLVLAVLFANGTRWLARRIASRHTPPPPIPA